MCENILTYYLILNRNCNFKCLYCIQGDNKPSSCFDFDVDLPTPPKVASYFPEDGEYAVIFYGGEPFLVFDYMMEIAQALKERNPHVQLRVTTNGSMLTKERAEKLNDIGMIVTLSHDGYCYETTRKAPDFLKVNPDPVLMLENYRFAATVTNYNWDFYNHIWAYFDAFYDKHKVKRRKVGTVFLKDLAGSLPDSLFVYNNPRFERMLDRVFGNLKRDIIAGNTDSYEYENYEGIIGKILSSIQRGNNTTICMYGDTAMALDVHGNVYDCHNWLVPVSGMDAYSHDLISSSARIKEEPCASCEVKSFCCGGCPHILGKKHKYICYYIRNEYSRLYRILEEIVSEQNRALGKGGGVVRENKMSQNL